MTDTIRLQKWLARAGLASRRHAEDLIRDGRVEVNGDVVTEMGTRIDPSRDVVHVDGKPIEGAEERTTLLLHKPAGVVTTMSDPEGRRTVADLVVSEPYRVVPVGRLDYATEGALLLTTDGELAHRLLHPSRRVPKVYRARVFGRPSDAALDRLRQGVLLEDGLTQPALVDRLEEDDKSTWVEVIITEGRPHQVRRMCEAIGHRVMRLVRTAVSTVELGDLRPGEYRYLSLAELSPLYALVDLPAPDKLSERAEASLLKVLGRAERRRGLLPGETDRPERNRLPRDRSFNRSAGSSWGGRRDEGRSPGRAGERPAGRNEEGVWGRAAPRSRDEGTRSTGDRAGSGRSQGGRSSGGREEAPRSYGGSGRSDGARSFGGRGGNGRSDGARSFGDRGGRGRDDGARSDRGGNSRSDGARSFGDRGGSGRSDGARSYSDRGGNSRSDGARSFGDRGGSGRSDGARSYSDRGGNSRSDGARSFGDRGGNGRSDRGGSSRSDGARSFGDRGNGRFGDRGSGRDNATRGSGAPVGGDRARAGSRSAERGPVAHERNGERRAPAPRRDDERRDRPRERDDRNGPRESAEGRSAPRRSGDQFRARGAQGRADTHTSGGRSFAPRSSEGPARETATARSSARGPGEGTAAAAGTKKVGVRPSDYRRRATKPDAE